METIFETPLLVARNSKGKKKWWQGRVVTDGEAHFTQTESYQETSDGTSTPLISTPKRIKGKNIGRSNETTPKEQAISEIASAVSKKRDKGYWTDGEPEPERLPLPMLAHSHEKRGHDVVYPAFVQPKLDGTRMLFDGRRGWSRQGKLYIEEVIAHLRCELPTGTILDGELMLDHNEYTFQDTIRAIKKYRPEVSPKLQFFVYDLLIEGKLKAPFAERYELLKNFFNESSGFCSLDGLPTTAIILPTLEVHEETQMRKMHGVFTGEGFEGLMVRNKKGPYKDGHRSKHLQKVKEFLSDEFPIVDVIDGEAKEEGCAIFICEAEGGTFNVRPKGTIAERQKMYDDREALIGQPLSVRFQEFTEDRIPRFPVGLAVRDYE